jgi:hypothetical protein
MRELHDRESIGRNRLTPPSERSAKNRGIRQCPEKIMGRVDPAFGRSSLQ